MDSQATWEYSKRDANYERYQRFALHLFSLSSQYGNAVQDDLWNAFDNQAKIDQIFLPTKVKTIMDTWTAKMG